MTPKPKIGLALGSGGARGWCHLGVIAALAERGIEADVVAGCSMGSLVGAAWLVGDTERLEQWARSVTLRQIIGLLDLSLAGGGLIEGNRIAGVLKLPHDASRIEELPKPFSVVASDLETGREVWLTSGPVSEAVRASISIPGIFSPARVNGRWLLDGGMTNPIPVSACRALGAEIIIAVNPNAGSLPTQRPLRTASELGVDRESPIDLLIDAMPRRIGRELKSLVSKSEGAEPDRPGYFSVLSTAIDIMTDQIRRSRLAGEPPHVLISPDLNHLSVLDFHRAAEAIEVGRAAVERMDHVLGKYF